MFGKGRGKNVRSLRRDGLGITSHPPGTKMLRVRVWLAVWSLSVLEVGLARVRKSIAVLVCVSTAGKRGWWCPGPSCRGELGRAAGKAWRQRAWDTGGSGSGGNGAQFGLSIALGVFTQSICILYQRKSRELKASDPWLASC